MGDVNGNDVHFYNAIKLLLQIDFVLNFASYPNDSSTLHAMEYESKDFDADIVSKYNGIGTNDTMWSVLSAQLNRYFDEKDAFQWPQRRSRVYSRTKSVTAVDLLTDKDWQTLYNQNYFDFRLYFLAKYIEKV